MTLIDSATAAVALGIGQRDVRRLVAAGKLTNHGTARRILLSLDEVRVCRYAVL